MGPGLKILLLVSCVTLASVSLVVKWEYNYIELMWRSTRECKLQQTLICWSKNHPQPIYFDVNRNLILVLVLGSLIPGNFRQSSFLLEENSSFCLWTLLYKNVRLWTIIAHLWSWVDKQAWGRKKSWWRWLSGHNGPWWQCWAGELTMCKLELNLWDLKISY